MEIWDRINVNIIDLFNIFVIFLNIDMEDLKWKLLYLLIYLYDFNFFIVFVVYFLFLYDELWKKKIWYCFLKGKNLVDDIVVILILYVVGVVM